MQLPAPTDAISIWWVHRDDGSFQTSKLKTSEKSSENFIIEHGRKAGLEKPTWLSILPGFQKFNRLRRRPCIYLMSCSVRHLVRKEKGSSYLLSWIRVTDAAKIVIPRTKSLHHNSYFSFVRFDAPQYLINASNVLIFKNCGDWCPGPIIIIAVEFGFMLEPKPRLSWKRKVTRLVSL